MSYLVEQLPPFLHKYKSKTKKKLYRGAVCNKIVIQNVKALRFTSQCGTETISKKGRPASWRIERRSIFTDLLVFFSLLDEAFCSLCVCVFVRHSDTWKTRMPIYVFFSLVKDNAGVFVRCLR